MAKVTKSADEWRDSLSPQQYRVLRETGTDRPFTSHYVANHNTGEYRCAGCGAPLFAGDTKYESGSGWPSFTAPLAGEAVEEISDGSHGMRRIEVRCAQCEGHLGHVFPDGPGPNGLRYCMNSTSLDFVAKHD